MILGIYIILLDVTYSCSFAIYFDHILYILYKYLRVFKSF